MEDWCWLSQGEALDPGSLTDKSTGLCNLLSGQLSRTHHVFTLWLPVGELRAIAIAPLT